ncbi:MAG: histidine--tRNA ligase [Elusimicrobia bacterium]|nr:histidine--tRNA ligase [Candidatus Liberimonas magnetica]
MKYNAPRGTHDLWGDAAEKIRVLEDICCNIFKIYNYKEIRFPTFEDADLFTRSIGETTDIVEKEMYVFNDRKGRRLALRPEGTAGVVRSYIENNLEQILGISKLFYMGSMFRYERPQAGRYREFLQIGAEYFNNPSPAADAEIILVAKEILNLIGLKDISIHINSLGCPGCRPNFRKALKDYFLNCKDLCVDCNKRIEKNPLRVLDCKIDSEKFKNAPKIEGFLCQECSTNFSQVQELLRISDCQFIIDHNLVRGLDYYTRTVFEIRSNALGAQDALAAGGRYDNLVEEIGGPFTPAVGFALGSERVIMALDKLKINLGINKNKLIFVAVSSQSLEKSGFILANKLKTLYCNANNKYTYIIEGPFGERSLKSQLRLADKLCADKVIIFGEEEFKRGCVLLKDMTNNTQSEIALGEVQADI